MMSLEEFREKFRDCLLELHWKQWTALGISSHIEEEKNWIIDLEALVASALFIGKFDKRLLSVSAEWVKKNGKWLNFSRLKKIGKHFYEIDKKLNEHLIPQSTFEGIVNLLKNANTKSDYRKAEKEILPPNFPEEYKDIFEEIEIRGASVEPNIQKLSLLQLYLRGIFGINARAEIFLYLASKHTGNSNQIAQEIFFDQKIVYRILESWAKSGFVHKEKTRKRAPYVLRNGKEFARIIRPENLARFMNWTRAFHLFARILMALHMEQWSKSEYLISSLFRDVVEEARIVGRPVDVLFSDSNLHKGADYFPIFAKEIMKLLTKMLNNSAAS